MKVFLHIGWHKTGTTALQKFLYANRESLRTRYRLDYPETALHKVAHNLIPWSFHPKLLKRAHGEIAVHPDPRALVREVVEESRRRGLDRLVLSSEVFSILGPERLRRLASALEGQQVTLIAYVRRQDRYIESVYNQMVKGPQRARLKFAEFLRRKVDNRRLDYRQYFSVWAELLGRENVRVRLYDRRHLRDGDIRRDFCDAVGIGDPSGLVFRDADDNASLGFESVQFLCGFNAIPHSARIRALLLHILSEREEQRPTLRSLMRPSERLQVCNRYREGNRAFAREFLEREDALELTQDELAGENSFDFQYGEEDFISMLSYVAPRLLAATSRAGQA